MAILHLHIGMHKTGTSSFQGACWRGRTALLPHGFNYHVDRLGQIANHSYFRDVIEQRRTAVLGPALMESFAANRSPHYIVSGEDISYLERRDLEWLAGLFRASFAEVQVYAVVRSPIAYMHSAAQEILKNPVTTVEGLFHRWDVTPSYERRFQKFIDLFGRVRFIAYGPDALTELGSAIGLPSLEYKRDNQSVSRWTAKMLAAMKPFPSWEAARAAAARLAPLDSTPANSHAPVELVEHWAAQVAQDRAWLESVWQAPPGFFDEAAPTVPRSYYETFSTEEVRILRSL